MAGRCRWTATRVKARVADTPLGSGSADHPRLSEEAVPGNIHRANSLFRPAGCKEVTIERPRWRCVLWANPPQCNDGRLGARCRQSVICLVLLFFHNATVAHKHPHVVACIFRLLIRNSGFDVVSLEVEDGVQTVRVREPRRVRRRIGRQFFRYRKYKSTPRVRLPAHFHLSGLRPYRTDGPCSRIKAAPERQSRIRSPGPPPSRQLTQFLMGAGARGAFQKLAKALALHSK